MQHENTQFLAVPEPAALIQSRERKGFLIIAVFAVIPVAAFLMFLWWAMSAPLKIVEPQKIQISRGYGFLKIGDVLAQNQIVRSASLFRLYALSRGWAGNLKPGEYAFRGEVSIPEVARALVEGPGDTVVVLPEGLTIHQIEERLVAADLVLPGEFAAMAHSPGLFTEEFPFLENLNAQSLEGFLFPDTYRFSPETEARAIVEKMLLTFQNKVFQELESKFRESPQSILDIIIMASMIERESAKPEDRRMTSDILWRRLEIGMPLQVDATVIYAWQRINPRWSLEGRPRLSFADLKVDSPYNTYRVRGLPPGPIANPGLDSIRAALNPMNNEYWFYLSPSDGTTHYSRTFEEHTALKAKLFRDP